MKGQTSLWIAAGGLALVTLLTLTMANEPGAAGSTLSRSAYGWLAARRVLEERGVVTEIVDRPLETDTATHGVLVVAFPWQHAPLLEPKTFERYLERGGSLLLGYSGQRFAVSERILFDALGSKLEESRPDPPLDPRRWGAYAREEWRLAPEGDAEALRPARVSALREAPHAPPDARVLYRNEAGRPIVFSFPRGKGRVFVFPSEMWANGRLAEPGNADWMVTLASSVEGPWRFDEFHHGLVGAGAPATDAVDTTRFMDLYLGQVLFVYALVVLGLARRFGPAWHAPPVVSGSVAGFLVGLGAVHARSPHHREAADALLARAARLDARLTASTAEVGTASEFLELAQAVGRSQRRKNG